MPGTALEQYFVSFTLKRQKLLKAKGIENILLVIVLLKIVYYLDIFETLIGRRGPDGIILSNLGKHFLGELLKMFFLFCLKLLKIDLTGRTSTPACSGDGLTAPWPAGGTCLYIHKYWKTFTHCERLPYISGHFDGNVVTHVDI